MQKTVKYCFPEAERKLQKLTFRKSYGDDMASTLVTKPKVHVECIAALVLQSQ